MQYLAQCVCCVCAKWTKSASVKVNFSTHTEEEKRVKTRKNREKVKNDDDA